MFSGIHSLCRQAGLHPGGLARVLIAGNFGRYFDIGDGQAIGLLPELAEARFEICGNTSLAGAARQALDPTCRDGMESLIERLEFVDLNGLSTFQDDFIDALFLPHRSRDLFSAARPARRRRRREKILA